MTPRDGQLDESPVRMSLALGRVDGDKDLLQELVHTFQEDLSERVAALTAAIRRGDDQETFHAAHSLRGPLGILCAEKALALAEELETLGRAGRLTRRPEMRLCRPYSCHPRRLRA